MFGILSLNSAVFKNSYTISTLFKHNIVYHQPLSLYFVNTYLIFTIKSYVDVCFGGLKVKIHSLILCPSNTTFLDRNILYLHCPIQYTSHMWLWALGMWLVWLSNWRFYLIVIIINKVSCVASDWFCLKAYLVDFQEVLMRTIFSEFLYINSCFWKCLVGYKIFGSYHFIKCHSIFF